MLQFKISFNVVIGVLVGGKVAACHGHTPYVVLNSWGQQNYHQIIVMLVMGGEATACHGYTPFVVLDSWGQHNHHHHHPCDTAPMTTLHLLQHCPLQDGPLNAAWPEVIYTPEREVVWWAGRAEEDSNIHQGY